MNGIGGAETAKTVYVGGLPTSGWSPESVVQHFSVFGDIINVSAPRFGERERSGVPAKRGFLFLTFASERDAMDAVDNFHLNTYLGKTLTVRIANKADIQHQATTNTRNNQAIWNSEDWLRQNQAAEDQEQLPIASQADGATSLTA